MAAFAAFSLAPLHTARAESINDCEKIQAADAYNRCLARFGPPARGRTLSARDFGGDGDPGAAAVGAAETAAPEKPARAARGRRHASRHSHHYSRHSSRHHRSGRASAAKSHGGKRVAYYVISGRER